MKNTLSSAVCVALIYLFSLLISSCADNTGKNKNASIDSTAKTNYHKMSAKERLAKNNIIEKHLNWESKKLKGKVKSFTKTTYKISETGDKTFDSKEDEIFDIKGNMIENGYFSQDNKAINTTSIMYDTSNNDTAVFVRDAQNKIMGRGTTKYDNRGNQIEAASLYPNGQTENKIGYKYDDKDNLTELDFFKNNGKLERNWTFTYDDNGFKSGGITYDSTGKITGKNICKYDTAGNFLNAIIYNADGTIMMIDSFKYDDKGNRIESATYNKNVSLISKSNMTYNEHGSRTSYVMYIADGSIDEKHSAYEAYEYDATGNITKISEYKLINGKKTLNSIIEYVIVYY